MIDREGERAIGEFVWLGNLIGRMRMVAINSSGEFHDKKREREKVGDSLDERLVGGIGPVGQSINQ